MTSFQYFRPLIKDYHPGFFESRTFIYMPMNLHENKPLRLMLSQKHLFHTIDPMLHKNCWRNADNAVNTP